MAIPCAGYPQEQIRRRALGHTVLFVEHRRSLIDYAAGIVGSRAQAALLELPERTRVDAGLRCLFDNASSPTGRPVAVRFFVENLFDSDHWANGLAAITLSLGTPRTFRLALTTDF